MADTPTFAVILLTAPPPGQMTEAGGALLRIDGRESLLRAAELFINRDNIKQIITVFEPDDLDDAKRKFGPHFALTGIRIASGGPRWLDQVAAALPKLDPAVTHVLIHDAARPCVPYSDIDRILDETASSPHATALVCPSRSTLLEVDDHGNPLAFHLPTRFVQLLTPQGFTRKTFEELAQTKQEIHASRLRLVKASPLNIRVGGPGDEKLAKTLLTMLPKPIKKDSGPFSEAQW